MRVLCRHGHFAFYPKTEREVARFASIFNQVLLRQDDFYTFAFLKDAPEYSLLGKPYLGLPALVTYAGKAWDVLRENGFVFDFTLGVIKPKALSISIVNLVLIDDFWTCDVPLIVPGSLTNLGSKIVSYDAQLDLETSQLKVFEVECD